MDVVFGDENLISLIFDQLEEGKDTLSFSHSFSKARKVCGESYGEDYAFELLQERINEGKVHPRTFVRKNNVDEQFFRRYVKAGTDRLLIVRAISDDKLTSQMIDIFFQDGTFQNKNGSLYCEELPVDLCMCDVFEGIFDTLTRHNIVIDNEVCGWHEKDQNEVIVGMLWDFYRKTLTERTGK